MFLEKNPYESSLYSHNEVTAAVPHFNPLQTVLLIGSEGVSATTDEPHTGIAQVLVMGIVCLLNGKELSLTGLLAAVSHTIERTIHTDQNLTLIFAEKGLEGCFGNLSHLLCFLVQYGISITGIR
jgi:hypothetical protein